VKSGSSTGYTHNGIEGCTNVAHNEIVFLNDECSEQVTGSAQIASYTAASGK